MKAPLLVGILVGATLLAGCVAEGDDVESLTVGFSVWRQVEIPLEGFLDCAFPHTYPDGTPVPCEDQALPLGLQLKAPQTSVCVDRTTGDLELRYDATTGRHSVSLDLLMPRYGTIAGALMVHDGDETRLYGWTDHSYRRHVLIPEELSEDARVEVVVWQLDWQSDAPGLEAAELAVWMSLHEGRPWLLHVLSTEAGDHVFQAMEPGDVVAGRWHPMERLPLRQETFALDLWTLPLAHGTLQDRGVVPSGACGLPLA